jgi:DNA invertase Pin-like site-specific DNA recombinase
MKAFGYVRCSSMGGMDGDGPIRQRAAIEKFCQENSIELAGVYEESHTGSDLEGRTEFHKMRSAMLANGVRMVICEKLDRLARSIMVQETILADFKKHGIELRSATVGEDDLCGTDPTRTLIRQILGCFFEYERKMIELKLRAARQRARAAGKRCEGRMPYGAKAGEAGTLCLILDLFKRGQRPEAIAALLNAKAIPTRYGRSWHPATVSKILNRHERFANASLQNTVSTG